MRANVGNTDRVIRLLVGLACLAGFFFTAAPLKWVLLGVAIVAFATGLLRFCGLYKLLGVNTCKV